MDDLSDKIQQLLSSPDAMNQIQSMMAAFSSGSNAQQPSLSPPAPPPVPTNGMDITNLLKIAPLLNKMQQDNDGANLLKALRPYMHDEREKRLDEAIRILQLMRFLPLLKDLGKGDIT